VAGYGLLNMFPYDVVKDKIDASLNNELSKDWSKVDKPTELAGWLMKLTLGEGVSGLVNEAPRDGA
jgi:hypothetical protein